METQHTHTDSFPADDVRGHDEEAVCGPQWMKEEKERLKIAEEGEGAAGGE